MDLTTILTYAGSGAGFVIGVVVTVVVEHYVGRWLKGKEAATVVEIRHTQAGGSRQMGLMRDAAGQLDQIRRRWSNALGHLMVTRILLAAFFLLAALVVGGGFVREGNWAAVAGVAIFAALVLWGLYAITQSETREFNEQFKVVQKVKDDLDKETGGP